MDRLQNGCIPARTYRGGVLLLRFMIGCFFIGLYYSSERRRNPTPQNVGGLRWLWVNTREPNLDSTIIFYPKEITKCIGKTPEPQLTGEVMRDPLRACKCSPCCACLHGRWVALQVWGWSPICLFTRHRKKPTSSLQRLVRRAGMQPKAGQTIFEFHSKPPSINCGPVVIFLTALPFSSYGGAAPMWQLLNEARFYVCGGEILAEFCIGFYMILNSVLICGCLWRFTSDKWP